MKRNRLLSFIAIATLLTAVNGAIVPRVHAAPSYNVYMNWFPEPEQGGFYYAEHMGLWQKDGINAAIHEFSYAIGNTIPLLLQGKAAFVMANADEVLQFRSRGAKIVAVMDTFQINPQGILYHANDTSIHSLADLSNHTLIYSFGAGYEPYLVLKYHYKNFKTTKYNFSSQRFALDPTAVNQCYVTSEPYLWSKQGLKVKYFLIASSGYNPYGDVMVTTEDMVKNHPDLVRAFVKGSIAGWYSYLKSPAATNSYMMVAPGAKNYPQKPDEQAFSYHQIVRLGLIAGGDAATHGIGYYNLARWKTLQQQMVSVGQKVGGVDVSQAYTSQFLPGKM